MSPLAQRLARNFTWLTIQEASVSVIGLVMTIYLARTLGPSSYGALGLAVAIVGVIATLVRAGSGTRATRQTALNPENVPVIYAQLIGFRLVSAVAGIVLLVALAPLLSEKLSFSAALLILCSLLLAKSALTVVWAFRGLDQMQVNAAANVTEKALTLLGVLLLVKGQGNDVLWVPIVEVTAAVLIVWWLRKRLERIYPRLVIEFRTQDWPAIAREAVPLGLAGLMGSVWMHGAVLILGWFTTSEAAAGFLVAQKVVLTLGLMMIVINRAAFPSTSRLLSGDSAAALNMLASLMRYYLVTVTPVILLVAFHAGDMLDLLFGAAYADVAPTMIIMLASLPLLALNQNLDLLLKAIPKPGLVLVIRTIAALVLVSLALLLIPRMGMLGAALAVVGSDFTAMLVLLVLVRRATGGLPLNFRCLSPFVAGGAAAAAYWMCNDWTVAMKLPVAGIVYLVATGLTKGVTADEVRSLSKLAVHTAREPGSLSRD
jgi:O-antigen/teichoic acid export membrane protein